MIDISLWTCWMFLILKIFAHWTVQPFTLKVEIIQLNTLWAQWKQYPNLCKGTIYNYILEKTWTHHIKFCNSCNHLDKNEALVFTNLIFCEKHIFSNSLYVKLFSCFCFGYSKEKFHLIESPSCKLIQDPLEKLWTQNKVQNCKTNNYKWISDIEFTSFFLFKYHWVQRTNGFPHLLCIMMRLKRQFREANMESYTQYAPWGPNIYLHESL